MTLLGAIFLGIDFLLVITLGRRGLLFAMAASVPFFDSVMFDIGRVTIGLYWVPLIIYCIVAIIDGRIRFRRSVWAAAAFLVYAGLITVVGPFLFAGATVVAGDQVGNSAFNRVAQLDFSSSNVAQFAYLVLSCLFLMTRESGADLRRCLQVVFGVGVVVALISVITPQLFPYDLFQNSSRNYYAAGATNYRAQGQFSEASHLGGFALAAAAYALVGVFAAYRSAISRIGSAVLLAASLVLMAASASGTAVAGLALFAVVGFLVLVFRAVRARARVSPLAVVLGLLMVPILAVAVPWLYRWGIGVIDSRLAGNSDLLRNAADQTTMALFSSSWGIGVGLGSTSASSLAVMLLGSVGAVGTLLFAIATLSAIRASFRSREVVGGGVALLALLCASVVSLSLLSPLFWFLLGVTSTMLGRGKDPVHDVVGSFAAGGPERRNGRRSGSVRGTGLHA